MMPSFDAFGYEVIFLLFSPKPISGELFHARKSKSVITSYPALIRKEEKLGLNNRLVNTTFGLRRALVAELAFPPLFVQFLNATGSTTITDERKILLYRFT
jgi:hypothetical protein